MLLYYISDRTRFVGSESERRSALLSKIVEASRCGVDFIQLREKDLCARELEKLACTAVAAVRSNSSKTRLLINSRTDIAIACSADGVHLRSDDISPREVRHLWASAVIGVSCHSEAQVSQALDDGADFAVLAPIFEKKDTWVKPAGLDALHVASQEHIRVFALGGVTTENAGACVEAGAAGVAGIRLFQENDIARVVQALRG
ncbi:MAG TPA: thiamine phosphate synthase [Terriglobales bacterium]|nr:thiamine phosphate synthase [Terriglobales bacterium]